jgi:FADH2-dependent halogenase
VFDDLWQSSTVMRDRMRNAKRVNPVQTASDFSYRNKRLIDHRLLRVGDAAGFMDPIFSAGVYLAMYSGKLAADTVNQALESGSNGVGLLERYEKRVSNALRAYWEMVEGFYTIPFVEVFFEPRHRLSLPSAVVALLAGELEGGWKIRWRMRLFFWLIWLQSKRAILPRISFEESAVPKTPTTACAHEEEVDARAMAIDR